MEPQTEARPESVLGREWYEAYRAEVASESGDSEAFISSLRELADAAFPGSPVKRTYAYLLERIREEGIDGDALGAAEESS